MARLIDGFCELSSLGPDRLPSLVDLPVTRADLFLMWRRGIGARRLAPQGTPSGSLQLGGFLGFAELQHFPKKMVPPLGKTVPSFTEL
jgi:hypothetical protein